MQEARILGWIFQFVKVFPVIYTIARFLHKYNLNLFYFRWPHFCFHLTMYATKQSFGLAVHPGTANTRIPTICCLTFNLCTLGHTCSWTSFLDTIHCTHNCWTFCQARGTGLSNVVAWKSNFNGRIQKLESI